MGKSNARPMEVIKINEKKLDAVMKKQDISIYLLCDAIKRDQSTIWRWKRDGFPVMAALAICYVLKCKKKDLI